MTNLAERPNSGLSEVRSTTWQRSACDGRNKRRNYPQRGEKHSRERLKDLETRAQASIIAAGEESCNGNRAR